MAQTSKLSLTGSQIKETTCEVPFKWNIEKCASHKLKTEQFESFPLCVMTKD